MVYFLTVVLPGLCVIQVQVNEYKELKETLNKMPSMRQTAAQPQQHGDARTVQPMQNRAPAHTEDHHQLQETDRQVLKPVLTNNKTYISIHPCLF